MRCHAVSSHPAGFLHSGTCSQVHPAASATSSVLRVKQFVFDSQLAGEERAETQQGSTVSRPAGMLTGSSACYDVYQAADGRWLAVAAIEPHFWAALCTKLAWRTASPTSTTPPARRAAGRALPAASIADAAGGFRAVVAILSALVSRQGGRSDPACLDVSVTDSVLRFTQMWIDQLLATGEDVSAEDDQISSPSPSGR